jgi:hypothetical protein
VLAAGFSQPPLSGEHARIADWSAVSGVRFSASNSPQFAPLMRTRAKKLGKNGQ